VKLLDRLLDGNVVQCAENAIEKHEWHGLYPLLLHRVADLDRKPFENGVGERRFLVCLEELRGVASHVETDKEVRLDALGEFAAIRKSLIHTCERVFRH